LIGHQIEADRLGILKNSEDHRATTAHYGTKSTSRGWQPAYVNNIFGDPEMAVWTDIPHTLSVTHNQTIWPAFEQTIAVSVAEAGIPVDGVLVTAWKNGQAYSRAYTTVNGMVNLTVYPTNEGNIYLTCFKPNYYPYEGIILVQNDCGDAVPGDANGSGICTGMDVTYLVRYFKGGPPPPDRCQCPPPDFLYLSADANADCSVSGLDITYLQRFFKGQGPAPDFCYQCPISRFLSKHKAVEEKVSDNAK
jgi:hypothetical protein